MAKLKKEIPHSFDKVQVNLDLLQGRIKEARSLLGLTSLLMIAYKDTSEVEACIRVGDQGYYCLQ